MRSKEIFFLILLIAAGVFFYYAYTDKLDWELEWGEDFFIKLEEFEFEESQSIEPPFPSALYVVNRHGDVEIQGTDMERIVVTLRKQIRRRTSEEAQEVANNLKLVTERDGTKIILMTNRAEFEKKRFQTSYTIRVPRGTDVNVMNTYGLVKIADTGATDIDNSYGEVIVTDIEGTLSVRNKYDDVDVRNVGADCTIDSHNSSVDVHRIAGSVKIFHRYGNLDLDGIGKDVIVDASNSAVVCQNVDGTVDVGSTYRNISLQNVGSVKVTAKNCDVDIDGVSKSCTVENTYGSVKVANLQGDLTISGKTMSVYGNNIAGEKISIDTTYRDVELEDFSGETEIIHSSGQVRLAPKAINFPIVVKGKYSDINFDWPAGGRYPIEVQNKGGEIEWKLPYELSFKKENSVSVIKAFMKDTEKSLIFLYTAYGTIRIEEIQ